jgi:hypothetical protein
VETNEEKKRILERLDNEEELGFTIEMNLSYGQNAEHYRKYCLDLEASEVTYPR